jgi:hypothetical protein
MNANYPCRIEYLDGRTDLAGSACKIESPQGVYKASKNVGANYIFRPPAALRNLPAFQRPFDNLSQASCNAQWIRFILEEMLSSGLTINELSSQADVATSTIKKFLYKKAQDIRPQTFFKIVQLYVAWHKQKNK